MRRQQDLQLLEGPHQAIDRAYLASNRLHGPKTLGRVEGIVYPIVGRQAVPYFARQTLGRLVGHKADRYSWKTERGGEEARRGREEIGGNEDHTRHVSTLAGTTRAVPSAT